VKRCLACGERFASDGWRCPACGNAPPFDGVVTFAPELAIGGGLSPESFEMLPEVEERSFWFRSRNQLIAWAIRTYFPAARSLLEVGCGTGFVLAGLGRAFPELQLSGSEISPAGLTVARSRVPCAELFQMDARRVPFDSEFDVIGAFDVLEHIAEDEVVLTEIRRAVRPGGGVVVTVPQHPFLWSEADEFSRHERRYTRRELVSKVEQAGLHVRRVTSFVTLLLPAMWLSRAWSRRSESFDPGREYRSSARVDRALERVMAVERSAIKRGFDLPVGGSLLVVATRGVA
jgi:SAM-dependent methyltransferase